MSDALWFRAGLGASVGSATIAAATDEFTLTAHGLSIGDAVMFDSTAGGGTILRAEVVYYVIAVPTANTFQVGDSPGDDSPIDFASDGSADVWFAVAYDQRELRRLQSAVLFKGIADRFGARQGVHPSNDPAVTVAGTTWTVEDITGVVYPGLTDQDGPYQFAHPSESGSLDPADGTNDRIDALDLQLQDDDEDISGFRRARVVYVAGTPAGSPVAPALTANSLRLATILVPSGGAPSPTVATLAVHTVAAGAVLPVRDDTELPTAGRYDGMIVWRQDSRGLEAWNPDATSWDVVAQRRVATSVRTVNSATTTTTEIVIDTVVAPVVAGRVYKITWHGRPHVSVSGDDIFLFLREDNVAGTVLQNMVFDIPISFRYGRVTLEAEYTADATEDKTFVAGLNRAAGTGNVSGIASATDPTYLYVDLVS